MIIHEFTCRPPIFNVLCAFGFRKRNVFMDINAYRYDVICIFNGRLYLFALPLGAEGGLRSLIMVLPGDRCIVVYNGTTDDRHGPFSLVL